MKAPRMNMVIFRPVVEYSAAEIRDIRLGLKLSQKSFDDLLGVTVKAVEAWEGGRNIPQGPTLRLLGLYEQHPELVPLVK